MYVKKYLQVPTFSLFLCQLFPYPAKAFGRNAQIGSYHPLGNSLGQIGVHFNKVQISLFCGGTDQQVDSILEISDMILQNMLIIPSKWRTDLASGAYKLFVQYSDPCIFHGINEKFGRLVEINTASITDEPTFCSKLDDMFFPQMIDAVKPKQPFFYVKYLFTDLSFAQHKLAFTKFAEQQSI